MTFLKPDDEDTDWLGPLDEWSERLLHETILPDTVPTWEYSQELEEEMNKVSPNDDLGWKGWNFCGVVAGSVRLLGSS